MNTLALILLLLHNPQPQYNVATSLDTLHLQPSAYIVFAFDACMSAVTIHVKDGSVIFAECYKPDKAAESFWRYLGHESPEALHKRIQELETDICQF
jgi:hypothetical protein